MRRLKSDVSHRIRPRGPSIFREGWLRLLLGAGAAVILGLMIGPSVASWFGADLPRVVWLLPPWGREEETKLAPPEAARIERGPETPAGQSTPKPGSPTESIPPVATTPVPPPAPAPNMPTVPAVASPPAAAPSGMTRTARKPSAPSPTAPPAVYRIQIGAFLEHANADRLVERLRTEGFGAATSVFEQSRMLYRVFAVRPEGGAAETASLFLERLRGLGFTVETSDEGSAVTGLVPLRVAVEASRRLREEDIAVRLKQEAGSATFRVVRVGSYATMEEAEQALAALAARGHEGVVVRER